MRSLKLPFIFIMFVTLLSLSLPAQAQGKGPVPVLGEKSIHSIGAGQEYGTMRPFQSTQGQRYGYPNSSPSSSPSFAKACYADGAAGPSRSQQRPWAG